MHWPRSEILLILFVRFLLALGAVFITFARGSTRERGSRDTPLELLFAITLDILIVFTLFACLVAAASLISLVLYVHFIYIQV